MALQGNFYEEIFEKEKYWTDLINRRLLNIYYLNGKDGLKEFYLNKKNILEAEYNLSNNEIIKNFINILDNILTEIDLITQDYRQGNSIELDTLSQLFLVNQMTNKNEKRDINTINRIQLEKKLLKKLREEYMPDNQDDYLYDDFPSNQKSA